MVIKVGINGFGRIGKCLFLQLLEQHEFAVCAINTSLDAVAIEKYINTDSTHGTRNYKVNVIDENTIDIKGRVTKLLRSRAPEELAWRENGVTMLFETTGAFLTTKDMQRHDVDYCLLSAPPKDLETTPMFVYGVNDREYAGEQIVSIASCTSSCLLPFLTAVKGLGGGIREANFLTVHAATASQSIVDEAHVDKRTSRSIFNNIIPHSTGASKTVDYLIPELKGKVVGTSIRVPINNCSMLDLNVTFNEPVTREFVLEQLETKARYPDVVTVSKTKAVSSDFIGSDQPTVVDFHQSFQLSPNSVKFALWYDNEWSYCAQMIRMARTMDEVNAPRRVRSIRDVSFADKQVFVRVDFNCPLNADGSVADDFRVRAALPTLRHILDERPNRVVVATHFGRPKTGGKAPRDLSLSTQRFVPILSALLGRKVHFVPEGLSATEAQLSVGANDGASGASGGGGGGGNGNGGDAGGTVYLLENTRFHDFETKPPTSLAPGWAFAPPFTVDVFVNEAFSASHRAHTSVTGLAAPVKCLGLQFLREVLCLDRILGRAGEVSVAICGGSKVDDKLPMLKTLSKRVDLIAIGGGSVNAINKDPSLLDGIRGNRAEILIMSDGFGNATPNDEPLYAADVKTAPHPLFDCGPVALNKLAAWLSKADIVFWNGALGITEHPFYRNGSEALVNLLKQCPGDVVIGGGDTAGFVSQFPDAHFYHVSTGGGASIDYLTKETLVGITYYDESNRPPKSPIASPMASPVLAGGKGTGSQLASIPDLNLA